MESQQMQANEVQDQAAGGGGKGFAAVCRQSSTRWTPTTDQIRILKDLYYNSGVRSPTAEQIQKISAKLRQYGKIEGKNVFYWFQNHKARERQKKRFTAPPPPLTHDIPMHHNYPSPIYNINHSPGNFASSSSPGYVSVANYGFGSVERSFRECNINPNGNSNYAWIGVDHYPNFLEKRKYDQTLEMDMEMEMEEEEEAPEIETLPLFPMHNDAALKADEFHAWYRRMDDAGARASLELTLNSYPTS